MQLRGDQPYLSVGTFPVTTLPSLVVLTGRNGSGKSQFLQAIEQGFIATDLHGQLIQQAAIPAPGMPRFQNELIVRLENSAGPLLALDQPIGSAINQPASPQHVSPYHLNFDDARRRLLNPTLDALQSFFAARRIVVEDPLSVVGEEPQSLAERLSIPDDTEGLRSLLEGADAALLTPGPRPGRMPDPMLDMVASRIRTASERTGIKPRMVTQEVCDQIDSWGGFPAFDPALTRVFSTYRDTRFRNRMQKLEDEDAGTTIALTDAQFREKFGEPPWALLNDTLQLFGLGYEVAPPPVEIQQPVTFVLKRLDNGISVSAGQLSSGERVLLRFALSLFQYDPLRVGVIMPRVLLLDEMDASLHPEMVSRWLTALNTLVEQRGVSCILTTHSPTTVALAPDDSLYELVAGTPKKVTKQEALNRLTFGVPTLSIDYSGRRQVFVESDTDAASYETLESVLKARVPLPRTLTFMSTGLRRAGQEIGTGCAVVTKIVSELAANGNASVYGLLDWDGANVPTDRVHILGSGTHYALDNLLLDPLLVAALLLRDVTKLAGTDATFASLPNLDPDALQKLIDAVEQPIQYPLADMARSESRYHGVAALNVRQQHQQMNGHELEALVVAAHPSLNRYSAGGRGKLTDSVVKRVLVDYPAFCPTPIVEAFTRLAATET